MTEKRRHDAKREIEREKGRGETVRDRCRGIFKKGEGEDGQAKENERGNIERQSPGRGLGPSHGTMTAGLSFIRINLLNVSPTIVHAIKLTTAL